MGNERFETKMAQELVPSTEAALDWRQFLTDQPVGKRMRVAGAACDSPHDIYQIIVSVPDIQLHCDEVCRDLSFFKGSVKRTEKVFAGIGESTGPRSRTPCDTILWYSCEKCGKSAKSYVVRFWSTDDVQKLAEWPPFAPRTPPKVMSLVGPDRELFLKGRRAEIEGLGIAAYAYYRRIIEDQKNRLLDEIIRVARHLGRPAEVIRKLETAKSETQFSKAVESVKEVIPEVLRIRTHNPLTLLHSALSEGLHSTSDEACLKLAGDIRVILAEFAERLTEAMKDQQELNDAVSRLVNRTS